MKTLVHKLGNIILGKDDTHEVPNKELAHYMFGITGQNWSYGMVGWFLYFCTDVLYFNPLIISSILALSKVWDAVNDPLVGSFVDTRLFKNGEKLRPWLKIVSVPIGILALFLFIDLGLTQTQFIVYAVIIYFLYDLLYSFHDVSLWGMTSLIATSSNERARVSQFGRIGGTIGSWGPGLIPVIISITGNYGFSQKTLFVILAAVFGFGGMCVSLLATKAKERVPAKKVKGNLMQSLKLVAKNKIVVLIVAGSILNSCTLVVPQIYFFKYMVSVNLFGLQISGLTMSFIFGILVGLPGTLAMLFAVWFSKKVGGMKNVIIISVVLNIALRFVCFFVGYEGIRMIFVMILLSIIGIPSGMVGIAVTTLWGDSLDYIEWKTGDRNEGSVFAMQNFTSKITGAISTFFTGITLSLLHFNAELYDQNLPQSDTFIKYVWPIFILGPALGAIFNLIPLLFIKYNKKNKELIEAKLHYIRAVRAGLIVPKEERFAGYNNLNNRDFDEFSELNQKAAFSYKKVEEDEIDW